MQNGEENVIDIEKDPYNCVRRMVFGRWKPFIIQAMSKDGVTNFSRFAKQLPITEKVLAQNLKALEADGLVSRTVIPDMPPRTEYRLTPRGKSIVPLLDMIYDWGWNAMKEDHMPVDTLGEMWHGYREKEQTEMMDPYGRRNEHGTYLEEST